jgi:hypothetical protein
VNDDRDRRISDIERRTSEEQRRTTERLRRQLASQRARAGASGVGGSASTNAIIRGLVDEASAIEQAREQEAAQSIATLNRNARNARRNNLLDFAGTSTRQGLSFLSPGSRSSLLDL